MFLLLSLKLSKQLLVSSKA